MLAATDMELSFAAYQGRQCYEVSPEGLRARAGKLMPGDKFRFLNGAWRPQPYPGHAVVTMVDGFAANAALAAQVRWTQHELSHGFNASDALYLLPPASFHQTIANTLSAENHQRLVVERGLTAGYPGMVTDVFTEMPRPRDERPVLMRMIGLSIFSTAIGLLGVFEQEEHFHRVLQFRDRFYAHERIAGLGIRRTRPFIGHITVAYLERLLSAGERTRLVDLLIAINREIATRELRFHLPHAELRAYDHLADFKPLPHLPVCLL